MKLLSRIMCHILCLLIIANSAYGFYRCVNPDTGDISFTNLGCPSYTKNTEIKEYGEHDYSLRPIERSDEELDRLMRFEGNVTQKSSGSIEKIFETDEQEFTNLSKPKVEKIVRPDESHAQPKQKNVKRTFVPSKYTVLHQIFDMYSGIHSKSTTEHNKRVLNEMIDAVGKKVDPFAPNDYQHAIKRLLAIHDVVFSGVKKFRRTTLAKGDCKSSYIMYGIGKAFDFPVHTSHAPLHVFLKYKLDNGNYINWEYLRRQVLSDRAYHNMFGAKMKNKFYGTALSENDTKGMMMAYVASAYLDKKEYQIAYQILSDSTKLTTIDPYSLNLMGVATRRYKRDKQAAIKWYRLALTRDPNFAAARENLERK